MILFSIVEPESANVNNIVDNYEQCGQHNIAASCFYINLEQVIIFRRVHASEPWDFKMCIVTCAEIGRALPESCLNACIGLNITNTEIHVGTDNVVIYEC